MTTSRPTWMCEVCHEPVIGRTGYLAFRYPEWEANREADRAWTTQHTLPGGIVGWNVGADTPPPGYVRWHVLHADCDQDPDSAAGYWIEVHRIRTWREVASWSAHLHAKAWFADTDWADRLYAAGVR